jgi:hypothetical protein
MVCITTTGERRDQSGDEFSRADARSSQDTLADALGYRAFFLFVMLASIPSILVAAKAPFPNPPDGGSKDIEVPSAAPLVAAEPPPGS